MNIRKDLFSGGEDVVDQFVVDYNQIFLTYVHHTDIDEEAKEAEDKRKKLIWQTAMYNASLQNGYLGVNWDNSIKEISPLIYNFESSYGMSMRALRLVGIGLNELPNDISNKLRNLEILSLANNQLTSLPENLYLLTNLRELNIMYNKIVKLPDRIGFMCSLEKLGLSNNCIETLPITFGGLHLIERIDLEQNNLTVLPENLDQLSSCTALNLNNNKLARIPKCIGRMPSLKSFSASNNRISYIPNDIAMSTSLRCLRLCVNQIQLLPERIGELSQLEELSIDYNQIAKLPTSFWKLRSLKVFRIEGNDSLLDPPIEILSKGGAAVVEYCKNIHFNDRQARMRHIILATQNVLQQVQDRDLADPSLFEPDIVLTVGSKDLWYGLQLQYFFKSLLPKLNQIWEEELELQENLSKFDVIAINKFEFTEHEVMWAFSNYSDAVGPVMKKQKAMFRRCSCSSSNSSGNIIVSASQPTNQSTTTIVTKKPCIPPNKNFMCFRECTLLKKHLVKLRDKHDRLWDAYKLNGLSDAMKRAAHEAKLYLESAEGSLWLEDSAYDQAEKLMIEAGVEDVVNRRQLNLEKKKKNLILKYDGYKEKIQKVRDNKLSKLQQELTKLKEDKHLAKEGYLRNAIEQRIQLVTVNLAKLPETAELHSLQEELERSFQLLEDGMYESDSVNTSEVDSSEFSSEDNSPEATKWRRRLKRRNEKLIMDKRLLIKSQQEKPQRLDKNGYPLTLTATEQVQEVLDYVFVESIAKPIGSSLARKYRSTAKKVNRNFRQIKEIASIRVQKIMMKFNGRFDEVQRELKYEIANQYIAHHISLAKEKARKEFVVIESVRNSVEGMSKEKSFKAWKWWVLTKRRRERKDLRKCWKMAIRSFDAAMQAVKSAQFQVDLWIKNKDIYTDAIYWQNSVNGDITYDCPALHYYLPPNFIIPEIPKDLPNDIPLLTSSSEDSNAEEWLKRYEEKQRRKREEQKLLNYALHSHSARLNDDDDDENVEPDVNNETIHPDYDDKLKELPYISQNSIPNKDINIDPKYGSNIKSEKFNTFYDENEEIYIGVIGSKASIQLQESVNYATEYTKNNSQYLAAQASLAVGGSKNSKKGGINSQDKVAHQEIDLFAIPSNIAEEVVFIKEKVDAEFELAYKNIRKKRNQLNPIRHHTYIHQNNRKPKSHEQYKAELLKEQLEKEASESDAAAAILKDFRFKNESELTEAQLKEKKINNDVEEWTKSRIRDNGGVYIPPTKEELLKLAGGNLDMATAGDEGLELRSVLAQRALHVKKKLEQQAEARNLTINKKKPNFYSREILPLFLDVYHGSSSEDEDGDALIRKAKSARRAKRKADREKKALVDSILENK